jgi:xanthine dehydrogenase accessory factor
MRAFVTATVVRAQRPSSVRPGDTATIHPDGTIEGFVGGVCAEQSVRLHALRALETGEALLLRIVPEGEDPHEEGAVTVANPCISGGGMEIFLQPVLPAPVLGVTGETPVAAALRELAPRLGFVLGERGEAAVVVASHGREEQDVLARALEAGVPYVGLVASRRRGEAVRAAVGAGAERIHTPAGLDIGARTPEEIALSILAEIVASRRPQLPPAPTTGHEAHEHHHHCHD